MTSIGAARLWDLVQEIEAEANAVEREWARSELRELAATMETNREAVTLRKWAGIAIQRADERFSRGDYHEAIEDARLGADLLQMAVGIGGA